MFTKGLPPPSSTLRVGDGVLEDAWVAAADGACAALFGDGVASEEEEGLELVDGEEEEELRSKVEVTASPVLTVLGPTATSWAMWSVCPLPSVVVMLKVLATVLWSLRSDCCFAVDVGDLCVAEETSPPMAHS